MLFPAALADQACFGLMGAHPDKGQQAVLKEAAGLAGAPGDGGQQQVLCWPFVRVALHAERPCIEHKVSLASTALVQLWHEAA